MKKQNSQPLKIGKRQINEAYNTFLEYREAKRSIEERIIENEEWYRQRHWSRLSSRPDEVQPTSAWLFNSIANKHADAMDNFPSPTILPRERGDIPEASMLSSIIPVILDGNDFEEIYSSVQDCKLKSGAGIYGVFWDSDKCFGIGDIDIRKINPLNIFWEPGVTDIQKSKNVFHVELIDNQDLISSYPQLEGKLAPAGIDIPRYNYDARVDTSNKSLVIDWYYKKLLGGRQILHFCKFVGDEVIFATENSPELESRGLYDHALYPFVFDVLYPVEGTPAGFGYIDIGKSAQEYIDRGNQAIMKNLLANAKPRHFIRSDGAVNEEEYANLDNDFIHVDGNLGEDSIMPVRSSPLNDIYVTIINNKITELKETTGNRDTSTGGTQGGVTAASAIAAMQEAGNKLSRDSNKTSYRAFKRVINLMIELVRQFYSLPRCFRIIGRDGENEYLSYTNEKLQIQRQADELGRDMGYRMPVFDVFIVPQKQSPYTRASQNEMALKFLEAGFFDPEKADQAISCLSMMDFEGKDIVMKRISKG